MNAAAATPALTMASLPEHVGRDLGWSDWTTLDQQRIDRFADCTGDRQWIHVDVERARRESPLGAPVAHGYLTLALLAPLAMQIGVVPADAHAVVNYGLDRVRFLAPVRAGARVRAGVRMVDLSAQGGGQLVRLANRLEIEGGIKPALVAETLMLVFARN